MSIGVRILRNHPQVEADLTLFEAEKQEALANIGIISQGD